MEPPETDCIDAVKSDLEPEQPDSKDSTGQDVNDNNALEGEQVIDHNDIIFFMAIRGLFDEIRAVISLEKLNNPADGNVEFACDAEPPPSLIDRHQPNLACVKVKIKPYQSSMTGMRASSRIASRLGGDSVAASSTVFRSSVLAAVNMSKMSVPASLSPGKSPFDGASWHSRAFSREETGESFMQSSESAASSARYSLGTASRTPGDYAEMFRRQEVSEEIDRRESRIKRTQEIHRKSEFKLKLRSLADPTVSVEREEVMALEAMRKERGRSRIASRAMTPALPLKKLSPIAKTSGPTENTITFRTEDYEGLESHVVMLEKNGELLVGENCFVVAKKPRAEMQQDLVHQSLVAPRFQLASPVELTEEAPPEGQIQQTQGHEQEHLRSPSRQAKGRRKTSILQSPLFEGQSGSFQSFPKLDLDPSKTKLAKGVVLHDSPTLNKSSYQALEATTKKAAPVNTKKPTLLAQIQEDTTNQHLDASMRSLVHETKRKNSHSNQIRQPFDQATAHSSSMDQSSDPHKGSFLPKHLGENEKHPQSLRVRTPAIRNRSSRKTPSWGHGEFDDEHEDDSELFSLQSTLPQQQRSLPKVSYMREFPSPSRGRIRMTPAASSTLLNDDRSSFPFASSLPVVIKQAKR